MRRRSRCCYQCSRLSLELSPRSRCVACEEARANDNEQENDELRQRIAELEAQLADPIGATVARARLAERDRTPAVIGFIADSYAGTRLEQDGFAEELALEYGFFQLDDDVEVYAATRTCLAQMLTAVGYRPANNAADPEPDCTRGEHDL